MVLESTIVCVDNSDYMRNGDFLPTRLNAQQDAVNLICHSKTRANPENNVGLISIANTTEVLVTLTTDVGKVLAKLHQIQPKGTINFVSAIRIAHLVLKHRQGKNHRMRIIVFVGSPVNEDDKELVKLAKKLRKEKVNVDVVNFGEEAVNTDKLTAFVSALNGSDGTSSSHLVTVPAGPLLSDTLISSAIIVGEDGTGSVAAGYEFGIDPNEDPELALALRVSMEEQRARQEDESRKATAASVETAERGGAKLTDDEQMLKHAMEMSMQTSEMMDSDSATAAAVINQPASRDTQRDLSGLTEEEQMAYALQMSLQPGAAGSAMEGVEDESTDNTKTETKMDDDADEDLSDVMSDPQFLQSVLEDLPGVNPNDDAVKEAVKQLSKAAATTDKNKNKSGEDKKNKDKDKKDKDKK